MQSEKTIESLQEKNSDLIDFTRSLLYEVTALEHEIKQLRLHDQMITNKYRLLTRLDPAFTNCN